MIAGIISEEPTPAVGFSAFAHSFRTNWILSAILGAGIQPISFRQADLELIQSALDGECGLLEAAISLHFCVLQDPTVATEGDRNFLKAIDSQLDHLPLGRLRDNWHADYLPAKDTEIAAATELWREELVAIFGRVRRALLLRKLVFLGHISVAERQRLGTVTEEEVANLIKLIVRENGEFPPRSLEPFIYEGAIVRSAYGGCEITWNRAYSGDPTQLAESHTETYASVDAAVAAFYGVRVAQRTRRNPF